MVMRFPPSSYALLSLPRTTRQNRGGGCLRRKLKWNGINAVRFRVVVAGESAMYVHTRTEPLTAGDRFKITPDSPDEIRVRHFAFDPVGPDSPEMLIVADRVM